MCEVVLICIVIVGPTLEDARSQLQQASKQGDVVELRLDCFKDREFKSMQSLVQEFTIPIIFTLRPKSQGGFYEGNEELRKQKLRQLASCGPAFMDLEAHLPLEFVEGIRQDFPNLKLILSYHDFEKSPETLEAILQTMPKVKYAFYKIAVKASTTSDTLRLMLAAKNCKNMIYISMGEEGEISRLLAPVIGHSITYACLEDSQAIAPGQIPASMLVDIYRYKSINPKTQLYGLIGDPITGSIGHLTNNAVMKAFDLDAVYVKMKIEPKDLKTSLEGVKSLGFRGLAVTMPLKEEMLQYLDVIDSEAKAIGAVSFVHFDQGRLVGYNKDGYGALESIERYGKVKNKKLIILGAGGASRAIAFEAKRRGAHVIILNRTAKRALQLAQEFDCEGAGLEAMQTCFNNGYDILINCLPYHLVEHPFDPANFLKGAVVMDITSKPMQTPFLKAAQAEGCRVVCGYQMFIHQTQKQFEIWFSGQLEAQKVFNVLDQTAQKALRID
jgi:3-dehydroquinate dehydratase / shikimate dehydrogenase